MTKLTIVFEKYRRLIEDLRYSKIMAFTIRLDTFKTTNLVMISYIKSQKKLRIDS